MTESFSFPLNVYARLLELQEGRVDYLHFGVFERPDEPVLAAQQRASDLLWQALPPAGRLLEVGIGLGTTLARLRREGWSPLGITPEAAQIDVAQRRHGPGLPLQCVRLEDLGAAAGPFDTLLFQESAQYVAPLEIFAAADRLLVEGPAHLVVMDEFALDRRDAEHWGLHHRGHFIALAQRCGWRLQQHTDLSLAVQPTLTYLIDGIRRWRARLLADLPVTPVQMDELDAALHRVQGLYAQGLQGYGLLRFERDHRPAVTPVRVGAGQTAEVQALFSEVFGHPLSDAEWAWKYGAWRGRALGLRRDGRLLAHMGGITRPVWHQGERFAACQVCDVIVHPSLRSGLSRQGALNALTATFLESEIGWGLPNRVGFGFPTDRAFGAAERLGFYAAVDHMDAASWPAAPAVVQRTQDLQLGDLQPGRAEAAEVDALWREMRDERQSSLLGERDAAWLRHRYLSHPRFRYRVVMLRSRWQGAALGVAVWREHEDHLEWVDWVAGAARLPELLRCVRSQAAKAGKARVEAWITASHRPVLQRLAPADVTWRPLGITVPTNVHSPGPPAEALRSRWWLTAGDTDFR
ncbi:MAG: bifunctional class I SAM-dependent methyltransferase/GNAT family N-acetyltransferase [Rubrivivax sp.]